MRVLVACEYSARVRDAFRRRGHDAWSCDPFEACEGDPAYHLSVDVLTVLGQDWDLMVAHPPCTRLANSGVRWLNERNLWGELDEAVKFFLALYNAPIPRVAVENPIPHRYALDRIGVKYTQVVQPWMFGHGETKATCLWLRNLPPLKATDVVDGREQKVHRMPPGPDRWKERSRTYLGLAEAMAEQWGSLPDSDFV